MKQQKICFLIERYFPASSVESQEGSFSEKVAETAEKGPQSNDRYEGEPNGREIVPFQPYFGCIEHFLKELSSQCFQATRPMRAEQVGTVTTIPYWTRCLQNNSLKLFFCNKLCNDYNKDSTKVNSFSVMLLPLLRPAVCKRTC